MVRYLPVLLGLVWLATACAGEPALDGPLLAPVEPTPQDVVEPVELRNKYEGLITANREDLAICVDAVRSSQETATQLRDQVLRLIPVLRDREAWTDTWFPGEEIPVRVEIGCPDTSRNDTARGVVTPSEYRLWINVMPADTEPPWDGLPGEIVRQGPHEGVEVTSGIWLMESQLCDDVWLEALLANYLGVHNSPDGVPMPSLTLCS